MFIAYIISNFAVAIVGLGVLGCGAYMNSVLTGGGPVFYNVTALLLGILMTIVSLSCYFFVGRYQRLLLSKSLFYHFLAKSALALSFALLTLLLSTRLDALLDATFTLATHGPTFLALKASASAALRRVLLAFYVSLTLLVSTHIHLYPDVARIRGAQPHVPALHSHKL